MSHRTPDHIRESVIDATLNGESKISIAGRLGIGVTTVSRIRASMPPTEELKGRSTLRNAKGELVGEWTKTKIRGMDQEDRAYVPDPAKIVSTATLVDQSGRVTAQWIREKPEEAERERLWIEAAQDICRCVHRVEPIPAPTGPLNSDLLACYPVGDHHLGMLAWGPEAGADYDLEIGERLLRDASTYLMQSAPACDQALVAVLGDFFHYDSFDAVTPTNRHLLDADSRYPKMVRSGIRALRHLVDAALERHGRVHVIVEIGNHDMSSAVFMMELLEALYENEPRVSIDTSPSRFHYYEFGKCLIGTHHGDGAKADKLPGIMAADRPEAWGRTSFRYWWTGHVHHRSANDYPGCSVESFRILAPADAWAAGKGYRSQRDMKAIILHREHGEVARHTVNPSMFVTQH